MKVYIITLSILIIILFALVCHLWIKLNKLTNTVNRLNDSFDRLLNNHLKFNQDINRGLDRIQNMLNYYKKDNK